MTKKLLLSFVIVFLSLNSFSQNLNEFRLYYGISDSELIRTKNLIGTASENINNSKEFGFRYLRTIHENLALETGLHYAWSDLTIRPASMGEPVEWWEEKHELLSVPLFANYTLWKYFFINGGPMLDLQLSENTSDPQDGIGLGLGIGGKYHFNNFLIFLNPNFKAHSIIPFQKENYHQKLMEFGIQFGIGLSL